MRPRVFLRTGSSKKANTRGMTLIEVMITLGIASGLILAVMEAVNMTAKSAKSIQVSSDWTNILGLIRLMTQNTSQCTAKFGGLTIPGVFNGPSGYAGTSSDLCGPNPTGHRPLCVGAATNVSALGEIDIGGQTILDSGGVVNDLRALQINLRVQQGNVTETVQAPLGVGGALQPMYRDTVYLEIYAQKMARAAGPSGSTTVPMPGANSILYAGNALPLHSQNGIVFQVLRYASGASSYPPGAAAFEVAQCFGDNDQAQLACNELGGTYGPSGSDPRCRLQRLFLAPISGSQTLAPPNDIGGPDSSSRGMRISLRPVSGWGSGQRSDYAIGLDSSMMWFSAGSVATSSFGFYNNNGGNLMMSLSGSPATLDVAGGVSTGNLAINGNTAEIYAYSNRMGNYTSLYGSTSVSPPVAGGGGGVGGSVGALWLTPNTRMFVQNGAQLVLGANSTSNSTTYVMNSAAGFRWSVKSDVWMDRDVTVGTDGGTFWSEGPAHIANDFSVGGNMGIVGNANFYGPAYFANSVNASQGLVAGASSQFYGTTQFNGPALMWGTGGNVPHACWYYDDVIGTVTSGSSAIYYYSCGSTNTRVMAGGVSCWNSATPSVRISAPNGEYGWAGSCNGPVGSTKISISALCCFY